MFSHMFLLFQLLLLLVFSQSCYLLILSRLSWLHGNLIFLSCFLVSLALRASTSYMCSHVSGTERVGFLKQDARGNLVVASLPVNFPFSAFCQRFLVRTSVGLNTIHTFLSHKNPWTDTFLRDLGLAKLRSTARVRNHQRDIQTCEQVDCHLSYDSFLALCSKQQCGPSSLQNPLQRDLQRTPAIWHVSQSQSQRTSYL